MGLVHCFVVVWMLSAQLVLTHPLAEQYYSEGGRTCKMCPPGEFQESCTRCVPCPAGRYTTEWNREDTCHRCYGDCRPDFHLKVVQNCTSKSDVRCICEDGFTCTEKVSHSTNCKYCAKNQEAVTTAAAAAAAAAIITTSDKHTPSSASSGHSSTSDRPCQFPKCSSVPVAGNITHLKTDEEYKTKSQLAAILCSVAAMGCLALVILFFLRRPGDESCFKQVIAWLICSAGGRDAYHKSQESSHQFPRHSFSAKQPSSLSAANLGPVHVHNPGTVIFSFLSQFTGQVGPTIEAVKTAEENERDCPGFDPTPSPSVHLSEEERSGEIDSIFFPSQEQGKDCHMSKEEAL